MKKLKHERHQEKTHRKQIGNKMSLRFCPGMRSESALAFWKSLLLPLLSAPAFLSSNHEWLVHKKKISQPSPTQIKKKNTHYTKMLFSAAIWIHVHSGVFCKYIYISTPSRGFLSIPTYSLHPWHNKNNNSFIYIIKAGLAMLRGDPTNSAASELQAKLENV